MSSAARTPNASAGAMVLPAEGAHMLETMAQHVAARVRCAVEGEP